MLPFAPPTTRLSRVRLGILLLTLSLIVVGIFFVHSTTTAGESFPSRAAKGQIAKAIVALAALLVVSRIDYRFFEKWAFGFYGLLLCVLGAMVAVKLTYGGIVRSLDLLFVQIQPSEIMKTVLILALALFLRHRRDQARLHGLLLPCLMTMVPMAMVLLQPDLGTSLMFPPVLLGMLLVAGARRRHLAFAVLVGPALLITAYCVGDPLMKDYQRARLRSFIQQDATTLANDGFQLHQSKIAIGSAGLLGKGFAKGTQNRLRFLPERHTDFIFSVIAEELGFVGALALILAYVVLILLILHVAWATREPFGRLVATGVGIALAAQTMQNLGMTVGLTPITGLPLPFVSFGGSSLVTSALAIGVVLSVARCPVRVVASRDLVPSERRRLVCLEERKPAGLLDRLWPVS